MLKQNRVWGVSGALSWQEWGGSAQGTRRDNLSPLGCLQSSLLLIAFLRPWPQGIQIDCESVHTLPVDFTFKWEASWFQFSPSSTRRNRCLLCECFWLALHRQQAVVGPDSIPNANPAPGRGLPTPQRLPGVFADTEAIFPSDGRMLLLSKELWPRLLTQELQQVVFPQLIPFRGTHPWRRWEKNKEEDSPLKPLEELLHFMPVLDFWPQNDNIMHPCRRFRPLRLW